MQNLSGQKCAYWETKTHTVKESREENSQVYVVTLLDGEWSKNNPS